MSRDELAVLDGGKCILQLRGVRPFLSDKYDLTQHPNYKLTSDYDPKNTFDIEKYLNRKEKINPNDEFVVIDAHCAGPGMEPRHRQPGRKEIHPVFYGRISSSLERGTDRRLFR